MADSSNVEAKISSLSSKKYASGIFLLHLSVMKLYYEDFETTTAAVLTQELQKHWYSRIWREACFSCKITKKMIFKYSMDSMGLCQCFDCACPNILLGWSPCCFEMCKDFVQSLSVQFDLPRPALFHHRTKTAHIISLIELSGYVLIFSSSH